MLHGIAVWNVLENNQCTIILFYNNQCAIVTALIPDSSFEWYPCLKKNSNVDSHMVDGPDLESVSYQNLWFIILKLLTKWGNKIPHSRVESRWLRSFKICYFFNFAHPMRCPNDSSTKRWALPLETLGSSMLYITLVWGSLDPWLEW